MTDEPYLALVDVDMHCCILANNFYLHGDVAYNVLLRTILQ